MALNLLALAPVLDHPQIQSIEFSKNLTVWSEAMDVDHYSGGRDQYRGMKKGKDRSGQLEGQEVKIHKILNII